VTKRADILCVGDPDDPSNRELYGLNSDHAVTLKVVSDVDELKRWLDGDEEEGERKRSRQPNVVFVSYCENARSVLSELLSSTRANNSDEVEWIHARSAGIDFITSPELSKFEGTVTNAKGSFSSTLAEYAMLYVSRLVVAVCSSLRTLAFRRSCLSFARPLFLHTFRAHYSFSFLPGAWLALHYTPYSACSYFAKDLPRLLKQQRDVRWEKYSVLELRGATLGVVGYGDIGKAATRLARAYGMKVIALKRSRGKRKPDDGGGSGDGDDDIAQEVYYGKEHIPAIFRKSDYVLCAAPLTDETRGMIGREAFDAAGEGTVFINVGRGPVVDEPALIDALQSGRLKGAGLDVMCEEPLPPESPLWKMPNVLLSPHNMDQTDTFMEEATQFFLEENLPRYVRNMLLLNPVDPKAGY